MAAGQQRFFFAPGGTECELDSQMRTIGTVAYCFVGPKHPISVTMSPKGTLKVCRGLQCMGNPPEHTPRLPAGRSVVVGPFRCTTLHTGVRCIVTKLGRGFALGTAGLQRV